MPSPLAYLNGSYVPRDQLSVPINDTGFVQGVTVVEQLRTFGGKLFRWDEHLARLRRSLEIIELDPQLSDSDFAEIAERLIDHNHRLLATGDDLGLTLLITPGSYGVADAKPWVAMFTQPVAFASFAKLYAGGQPLVVADTRQIPSECWPAELKCRSRMHYFLADRQARRANPQARALLLNLDGTIGEASTANFLAYFKNEGIVSPPKDVVLAGVSMSALRELAAGLSIPFVERPIEPEELGTAAEAFLTSTSPCILPVTAINGKPIGGGESGPVFGKLLSAWSDMLGVDIAGQSNQFAAR